MKTKRELDNVDALIAGKKKEKRWFDMDWWVHYPKSVMGAEWLSYFEDVKKFINKHVSKKKKIYKRVDEIIEVRTESDNKLICTITWFDNVEQDIRWQEQYEKRVKEEKERKAKEKDEELQRLRNQVAQHENEDYCKRHGHDWFRLPYCGIGDTNYLTCTRCGAETTD